MYDYYLNHLVSDEAHDTLAPSDWSYAYDNVSYFRVSHPYMRLDTLGDPPRSAH